MDDPFESHVPGLESPPRHAVAIVPADGTDLGQAVRAINVAGAGSVRVTTVGGATVTLQVAAGIAFPICARRVWASGTSATGIVGLW